MILLLLACAPRPAPGEPLTGVLAALDRDRDGVVTEAEYDAGRRHGPTFAEIDRDGDGALTAAEADALLRSLDPASFDPALGPGRVALSQPPALVAGTLRSRQDRELLVFLVEEIQARDATAQVPTTAELDVAAEAGLGSPEGQALLGRLKGTMASLSMTWPPGLP